VKRLNQRSERLLKNKISFALTSGGNKTKTRTFTDTEETRGDVEQRRKLEKQVLTALREKRKHAVD